MTRIRPISEDDAAAYLALRAQLDAETSFLLLEPGERTTTVEEQREQVRRLLASDNQTILVAEVGGELVGFLTARGGPARRNRHSVHLALGVLRAHWGRGLGPALLAEVERWARSRGLRRLELTVMVHNKRAIALYERAGFTVEGTRREALIVDGRPVDELAMARLLSPSEPAGGA